MPTAGPNVTTLEAALDELGPAWVLVGDMLTANGLMILGLIEGTPAVNMNQQYAERTYERTGNAPWDAKVIGYKPEIQLTLINGDAAVYAKVSPTGVAHGGHTSPQPVTETSLVLVPESEFVPDGLAYTTNAWVSPAQGPKHAIWIPRGYFTGSWPVFAPYGEGLSKAMQPVSFTGLLARDAAFPEGAKSWIIGDPAAAGVTGLAI